MPKALIIGGSIGGLMAAHLLRARGWDVAVLERVHEDLAGRGAGIGTHPALMAVMQKIGVTLDPAMTIPTDVYVCLDRTGRVIHEVPMRRAMSAWSRFYRPLRARMPAGSYRAGKNLLRVEQDAQGVTAHFSDGTRERGDLLVGADGLRSSVREQFLPDLRPAYAGYVAWRAMLDAEEIPAEIRPVLDRYTFCLPPGEISLSYPVPTREDADDASPRRAYNIVWYRPVDAEKLDALCTDAQGHRHNGAIPPPLVRPEVVADVKASARALLPPAVAELVNRTPQPFFQAIYDLAAPQLVFGRVALLGDAAAVARPHLGAGVTKAALDALALARAAASGDLAAGLADYERERRDFGHWIVTRSRQLGAWVGAPASSGADMPGVMQDYLASVREIGRLTAD
jgi:2-polyprenyl-6-methoxyphenol hydroxylase-like FAD-dependent oxidoreductase